MKASAVPEVGSVVQPAADESRAEEAQELEESTQRLVELGHLLGSGASTRPPRLQVDAADEADGADGAEEEEVLSVGVEGQVWRAVRSDAKMRSAPGLDAAGVVCDITAGALVEQLGPGVKVT